MLTAGNQLDANIARRLWKAVVLIDMEDGSHYFLRQEDHKRSPIPPYSTSVDECYRVVSKMQSMGWTARLTSKPEIGKYHAAFTKDDGRLYRLTEAETLPLAVCLAALAAYDGLNVVKE